jgi:hypothetical protein
MPLPHSARRAQTLREKLESECFDIVWRELRPHAARDGLFVLEPELGLVNTALAIAEDRTAEVHAWLAAAKLRRPTAAQLEAWEQDPEQRFRAVIVQPFVLAEKIGD